MCREHVRQRWSTLGAEESFWGVSDANLMFVFQQGLFHPARKVRDVYWKIYNSIYIGSQDALIAHYPLVYNDEKNPFVRFELEYFM